MTAQLAILHAASLIVPRTQRAEWLSEWKAELWYVHGTRKATAFSMGAFPDAIWLRRNHGPVNARGIFQVESPLGCIASLALLAGASFFFSRHTMKEIRILPHLLIVFIAFLVMPVATSLNPGECTGKNRSLFWTGRRWAFFATKVALLAPTVFCAALTLVSIGAAPIQGQALLAGYVLAFRWALMDQRRRCPVCLHVLTSPVRIGEPSHTFLAWYGTELICAKGHGVLQVPEIATSCYGTQRWLYFDSSWDRLSLLQR